MDYSASDWALEHWVSVCFARIGVDPTKIPECLCAVLHHSAFGSGEAVSALQRSGGVTLSAQRQVEWLCQYIKSLFAWLMTEWVASQPFPKDIQEICGKAWMQSGFVAILLSFWPCESVRVAVLFATILIPNIERLEEYFHVYFFLLSVICWLKKMKLKYLLSWYNCCNFLNYQEHPERSSFCESK